MVDIEELNRELDTLRGENERLHQGLRSRGLYLPSEDTVTGALNSLDEWMGNARDAESQLSLLKARVEELERERDHERERACGLLEAAWEALSELGFGDSTAQEKLVPAILKHDGDPDYARSELEVIGFDVPAPTAQEGEP